MAYKLNLGCGDKKLDGFKNLDKPWTFEKGLPYKSGRIEAITISHALMYVREDDYPEVFAEFHRVLRPGGIVRITEDCTDDPKSERFGGYPGATTLTTLEKMKKYLLGAGFSVRRVSKDTTFFKDQSLLQKIHGDEPRVFFIEGIK